MNIEQLTKENAELKAQVNALRACIAGVINKWEGVTEFEATKNVMSRFIKKTREQCLAEHDTEVAIKAFAAGAIAFGGVGMAAIVEDEAEKYAEKLRQQVKAGE